MGGPPPRRAVLPLGAGGGPVEYTLHEAPLPQAAAAAGDGCAALDAQLLAPGSAAEAAGVQAALVAPHRRLWMGLRRSDLAAGGGGGGAAAIAAATGVSTELPPPGSAPRVALGNATYRWAGGAVGSFDAFAAAAGASAAAAAGAGCVQLDTLSGEWHPVPCGGDSPSVAGFACEARSVTAEGVRWATAVGGRRYAHVAKAPHEAAAVAGGGGAVVPDTPAALCAAHGMAPASLEDAGTQAAVLQRLAAAGTYWLGYAADTAAAAAPAAWTDGSNTSAYAPTPLNQAAAAATAAAAAAGGGAAFCGLMAATALPAVNGTAAAAGGGVLLAPCGAAAAAPLCVGSALVGDGNGGGGSPLTVPPAAIAAGSVTVAAAARRQTLYAFGRIGAASSAASYSSAAARCKVGRVACVVLVGVLVGMQLASDAGSLRAPANPVTLFPSRACPRARPQPHSALLTPPCLALLLLPDAARLWAAPWQCSMARGRRGWRVRWAPGTRRDWALCG